MGSCLTCFASGSNYRNRKHSDTGWPISSVAYAIQAHCWLTRALQGEIDDGLLTEAEAIELATRFMCGNQEACFDLAGTRQALRVSAAG